MTVALVLAIFAAFITLDVIRNAIVSRKQVPARVPNTEPIPALAPLVPVWVAGYSMPEELHYHRGHTWAQVLPNGRARIGLDDFARQLVGRATAVQAPQAGERVRQGAGAFDVRVGHRAVSLVAPLDGHVVAVNPALAENPALASDEPYGRGWLVEIQPTGLKRGLNNLLSGGLAQRFMEHARQQLELGLMALSGSVLQDGGVPIADFARELSDEDWQRLTHELLLA